MHAAAAAEHRSHVAGAASTPTQAEEASDRSLAESLQQKALAASSPTATSFFQHALADKLLAASVPPILSWIKCYLSIILFSIHLHQIS